MKNKVNIKFKGYHGFANYTPTLGWICSNILKKWNLYEELGRGETNLSIHMGTAHLDNVRVIGKYEMDVAMVNSNTAYMGYAGLGLFKVYGEKYPNIVSLGSIPHDDNLVFAVDVATGVNSIEDIKKNKVPLRIATNYNDGVDHVGFVVEEVLKAYGFSSEELESWGGKMLRGGGPQPALKAMVEGRANAIFHEGLNLWPESKILEVRQLKFLPFREDIVDSLEKNVGVRRKILPKGKLNAENDTLTLDWGDWQLITTERLDDDVAYLIASILIEDKKEYEDLYTKRVPPKTSVDVPVTPEKVLRTLHWGLKLHPGAERYYREKGFLK